MQRHLCHFITIIRTTSTRPFSSSLSPKLLKATTTMPSKSSTTVGNTTKLQHDDTIHLLHSVIKNSSAGDGKVVIDWKSVASTLDINVQAAQKRYQRLLPKLEELFSSTDKGATPQHPASPPDSQHSDNSNGEETNAENDHSDGEYKDKPAAKKRGRTSTTKPTKRKTPANKDRGECASKRMTRAQAKKSEANTSKDEGAQPKTRGRKRKTNEITEEKERNKDEEDDTLKNDDKDAEHNEKDGEDEGPKFKKSKSRSDKKKEEHGAKSDADEDVDMEESPTAAVAEEAKPSEKNDGEKEPGNDTSAKADESRKLIVEIEGEMEVKKDNEANDEGEDSDNNSMHDGDAEK